MGAQKNYFGLIYAILMFKSYWPSVRSEKSEPLIDALSKIDFDENDKDWDTVPSNKVIAESCGLSRTKVNQMIRKMYADILFQFNDNRCYNSLKFKFHILLFTNLAVKVYI